MPEGIRFDKRRAVPVVPPPSGTDPIAHLLAAHAGSQHEDLSPEYIRRRAQLFATRNQETIAPPSFGEAFYGLSREELLERYPARYERYAAQVEHVLNNQPPKLAEQRALMQWFYMMNSLDRFVHARPTSDTHERALKPKQFFAVEAFLKHLESGKRTGYMSLPTGFGKTVVLAKLIEAMNVPAPSEANKDMREVARTRTLVVVPSLDLIPKTIGQFAEFAPGLDVGGVSGKPRSRFGDHVTVITYPSFRNRVLDGRLKPTDFDVLVLDEAHEAITELCGSAIDKFRGHAVILGLSATPDYGDGHKNLDTLLEHKICEISLQDGVEMGLLCDFTAEVYNTHIDVSSVPRLPDGRYSEKEWNKLVNVRQLARLAARIYKDRFMGQKLYLFAGGITAAGIITDVFAEEGIPSACSTSDTEDDDRAQHWNDFEHGDLLAFASVNQFIRGNDCKRASVAINMIQTGSQVRAQQRGGRVLRVDPLNPGKHAHILDFLFTDRRGNAVTFAQIAGREPIDITINYQQEGGRENLSADVDTDDHTPIAAEDLADTDVGVTADTELVDVVTIEAQKRMNLESDIYDTLVTIERLYEEYATQPAILDVEHEIMRAVEKAIDDDDSAAFATHDTRRERIHAIGEQLRGLVGDAYVIADQSIQLGGTELTLEHVEKGLAAIQLVSFKTQSLFEEAAEIAVEYSIDIINLHEEILQAK